MRKSFLKVCNNYNKLGKNTIGIMNVIKAHRSLVFTFDFNIYVFLNLVVITLTPDLAPFLIYSHPILIILSIISSFYL